MTDHELQLKASALRRAAFVASAILADVEPGFQPGGKNRRDSEVVHHARARWQIVRPSGRQAAARYGRHGCPPLQPRRASAVPAFQPEGLMEYSPGLRAALPWVCVPQNSLHPEGVRERATLSTALAPLQGAEHFWPLTQGSSRCAQTTLGFIPVALQATQHATSHHESRARRFPRLSFRVFGVFRGENLFR
jgi:hypothetical protein